MIFGVKNTVFLFLFLTLFLKKIYACGIKVSFNFSRGVFLHSHFEHEKKPQGARAYILKV